MYAGIDNAVRENWNQGLMTNFHAGEIGEEDYQRSQWRAAELQLAVGG
jgi:hypothetical protein